MPNDASVSVYHVYVARACFLYIIIPIGPPVCARHTSRCIIYYNERGKNSITKIHTYFTHVVVVVVSSAILASVYIYLYIYVCIYEYYVNL